MKLQEIIQLTFVASLVLMGAGCKALQNFSAGQEWSSNYALMEGAQANDPALTGQSRIADCRRKRGGLHDHSGTAAVGPVVYAPVAILTIITRIPEV